VSQAKQLQQHQLEWMLLVQPVSATVAGPAVAVNTTTRQVQAGPLLSQQPRPSSAALACSCLFKCMDAVGDLSLCVFGFVHVAVVIDCRGGS
jgi:hypothetical protein